MFALAALSASAGEVYSVPDVPEVAGKTTAWTRGADGVLLFTPDPRSPDGTGPGLRLFAGGAGQRGISMADVFIMGSPVSVTALAFSGGRDLASCGDQRSWALRMGWDVTPAALARRALTAVAAEDRVAASERLVAVRLLQELAPEQAAALLAPLGATPGLDRWTAAALRPTPPPPEPAAVLRGLALHRDLLAILRPGAAPAQSRGTGAGRSYAILGMAAKMDAQPGGIDPSWFAANVMELDAVGFLPIELARRHGNLRIDAIVVSMAGDAGISWTCDILGEGLEAVSGVLSEAGAIADPAKPGLFSLGPVSVTVGATRIALRAGVAPALAPPPAIDGCPADCPIWVRASSSAVARFVPALAGLEAGNDVVILRLLQRKAEGTTIVLTAPAAWESPLRTAAAMVEQGIAQLRRTAVQPARGRALAIADLVTIPLQPTVRMTMAGGLGSLELAIPGWIFADAVPLPGSWLTPAARALLGKITPGL